MNFGSDTIRAAGLWGLGTAGALIVLAVISPEYYNRIPPGGGEILVSIVATIGGRFKKENRLKARWEAERIAGKT